MKRYRSSLILLLFAVPALHATTTTLPWWMTLSYSTPATSVVTQTPTASTTVQQQVNNGFNGAGVPTEPILGSTAVIPTPTTTPTATAAQNSSILSPSPAPTTSSSTRPWWMSFSYMGRTPAPVTTPVTTPVTVPVAVPPVIDNLPVPPPVVTPLDVIIPADVTTPEPGSLMLLAGGIALIVLGLRRKKNHVRA